MVGKMSPRVRSNMKNAKAGLWEIRINRFNPFEPDQAIYLSALQTKLPNHKSVSSELRGIALADIPEDQLEVWANIPDNPMMLHINYPAMVVSAVRAIEACINEEEKLAMAHYLADNGFKIL